MRNPARSWELIPALGDAGLRAAEEAACAAGLPASALMERAALAIAAALTERLVALETAPARRGDAEAARQGGARTRVGILAGPGHNGADALAVARLLHEAGFPVRVHALGAGPEGNPVKALRLNQERYARALGLFFEESAAALADWSEVLVDGLLGFGTTKAARGGVAQAIEAVNARAARDADIPLWSIDVPSGLSSASGLPPAPDAAVVRAHETFVLGAHKAGLVTDAAAAYTGALHFLSLGLFPWIRAEDVLAEVADLTRAASRRERQAASQAGKNTASPPRSAAIQPVSSPRSWDHKYSRGRTVVIAGTSRYPGAGVLAVRAAWGAGASYVHYAGPRACIPYILAAAPETVASAWEENDWAFAQGPATILWGSGYSPEDAAALWHGEARLRELLMGERCGPCILDAGAMQFAATIAGTETSLKDAAAPGQSADPARAAPPPRVILTPHAGEFAALPKYWHAPSASPEDGDPFASARALASRVNAILVRKGPRGLLAAPDGRVRVLLSEAPHLATAGTGDVFAGYLAGRLCARAWENAGTACADLAFNAITAYVQRAAAAPLPEGRHLRAGELLERILAFNVDPA